MQTAPNTKPPGEARSVITSRLPTIQDRLEEGICIVVRVRFVTMKTPKSL